MISRRIALVGIAAVVLALGFSGAASAAPVIQNGDFLTYSGGSANGFQVSAPGTSLANWSLATPPGYTFLYTSAGGATSGVVAYSPSYNPNVALIGPLNGPTAPDGPSFVAQDPAFQASALTQTITGLTPGATYAISFEYAAAEQAGTNTGVSVNAGWYAGLGSLPGSPNSGGAFPNAVGLLNTSSNGTASAWTNGTLYVTEGNNTTDTLFLAAYSTSGLTVPPFALIDSISITPVVGPTVPEPSSMSLLVLGVLGVAVVRLRRRS